MGDVGAVTSAAGPGPGPDLGHVPTAVLPPVVAPVPISVPALLNPAGAATTHQLPDGVDAAGPGKTGAVAHGVSGGALPTVSQVTDPVFEKSILNCPPVSGSLELLQQEWV